MSVYLDHQATSPMPAEVREVYVEALKVVGNPSSVHRSGQAARALVEDARARIAALVDADPMEVIFTSGGTEAINHALKGSVWAAQAKGAENLKIASPRTEHHATLDALEWLEHHEGVEVLDIPVDGSGVIDMQAAERVLNEPGVVTATTLLANNEVGSIQPVQELANIARARGIFIHVDAVSSLGYIPVRFQDLGVDALSISAHKVGGPVGVGALVLSRVAPQVDALLHGGSQQRQRSGTMDAAGVVAFASALELREQQRRDGVSRLASLRDRLRAGILAVAPECIVRGSLDHRLPGNLHITVPGCEGDVLLYLLDERGIQVSTGSACQAGVPEPSHVLMAMGVSEEEARGALRFSLSYSHTEADVDEVIAVFGDVVEKAKSAGLASR